ncbi:hypothetical protein [Shewanella woodyi]|uniref:hypothetical protein n=1 Tax=Shewanella woodyi TaxID=60961 RepID=UPI0007F93217|nr:hypothetical protein [Shewanella woodyi]
MKTITLALASLLAVTNLSGCSNAVTYHHSERNSIALETRATDPQQPVQGTIGIKTRTIVVTPKVEKTDGKSTNVVSDFELKRKPNESWYKFGTTEISSSFMTGQAAVNATPNSILAVNGLASNSLGEFNVRKKSIVQNIYQTLGAMKEDEKAKSLSKQLDDLSKLLPDVSKMKFYNLTKDANGNATGIKDNKVASLPSTFKGVLRYINDIEDSIIALDEMLVNRSVTYNGQAIDKAQLASLTEKKASLIKERGIFATTIGNSPVIDAAAGYVLGQL